MRFKLFAILLPLFLSVPELTKAQSNWEYHPLLPDSINQVLDTAQFDKRPKYIYRHGHKAYQKDIKLGFEVYQLGIDVANELEDKTYYSYGFYYFARLYQHLQKIDSARIYFLKTAAIAKESEDSSLLATVYERIALDYINDSKFAESNKYYKAALTFISEADTNKLLLYRNKIALNHVTSGKLDSAFYYQLLSEQMIGSLSNPITKGEWYWNLSLLYKKSEQPDIAIRYFKKTIEVFTTCPGNVDCDAYRNASTLLLASSFVDNEVYDSAAYYFNVLASDTGYMSSPQVFGFHIHKSRLYEKMGDYVQAIYSLQTSNSELRKQQNFNNQFGYYSNSYNIGKMFVKLENYGEGVKYLQEAVNWFEENNNSTHLADAYDNLSIANYQNRNFKSAYDYQRKLVLLTDSLNRIETDKNLQELNTKYEVADRIKEIALLESEKRNQALITANQKRNLIILLVVLGIVILIASLIYLTLRKFRSLNEKLNQQNEKIRQSEEIKTRWFVNISHELKTPLTLISGPVNKILHEDNINTVVKEDLSLAERNIEKLSGIVNEILDISRLEDGKLQLNMKAISLNQMIRNVVSAFDSTVRLRNIELTLKIAEEIAVEADENQLMKVLTNLISNALKFSSNNSEICVKLRKAGEEVIIEVTDQGIGIREQDVSLVFDRFYQAGDIENAQQGGTGVGLSLSKEIMELHGGRMSVVSKFNQGSTFSAILPANLQVDLPAIVEVATSKGGEIVPDYQLKSDSKPKLLIVEDNEDMKQYLKSLLKFDYNITEASEGQEGLNLLEQSEPDLIISDVMMPGMDGITFAKKVKSIPKYTSTPFITLTALNNEEDKLYTLKLGVDDYINKPFNAEELKTRISNLLHNRKVRLEMSKEIVDESYDDKTLVSLEKEIQVHLTDGLLNIPYLANSLSMSERNFQRYVKKVTGLTPLQLINDIRLKKALQLLEKRVYPTVKEIGIEVGFNNASHFTDLFRKRYGKKPGDYLK